MTKDSINKVKRQVKEILVQQNNILILELISPLLHVIPATQPPPTAPSLFWQQQGCSVFIASENR